LRKLAHVAEPRACSKTLHVIGRERSRCVAAITRTSIGVYVFWPSLRTSRFSSTRNSFGWRSGGSSPISSKDRLHDRDALVCAATGATSSPTSRCHEVDDQFHAQKGLRSTSAAWAAAVLTDLGMSPGAVQAVSNYWVAVCVYAQALFSSERAT
jgi:hypothetical protein